MTVRRYPLPDCRELRTTRTHGRIFLAVHLAGGAATAGQMAIRDCDAELDTLRSALADLAGKTGPSEATPDAQASRQGDVSRGGGTP